ncbi:MAG: hypothetical protein IKQ61_07275 [Spirochaetales bacterium]|nr:hypothetical protein [Spirochaetales bacterium]
MSAGYGYYKMEFYKNDGTPDEKKAKEAFDFCMKQYEWFREGEPFVLEDNSIIGNYDKWSDGLVLDMGIPHDINTIKEWLMAIYNAGITCFAGQFIEDKSEDSWEDNWVITCSAPNKPPLYPSKAQYNKNVFGRVLDNGDQYYYALDPESYSVYHLRFRNKQTGAENNWFYVEIVPQPDSGIKSVFEACCAEKYCCRWRRDEENTLYLMDKNNNYLMPTYETGLFGFDHFDKKDIDPIQILVKGRIFKKAESKDWEFVGFFPEQADVFTRTKDKLAGK